MHRVCVYGCAATVRGWTAQASCECGDGQGRVEGEERPVWGLEGGRFIVARGSMGQGQRQMKRKIIAVCLCGEMNHTSAQIPTKSWCEDRGWKYEKQENWKGLEPGRADC